ncbi:polyhydroxyalkanoate synthase [Kineococcus xinjiangensis]|uniref:Polyhydroxyalkanoate synthase n=1 Tax=Kineococcus xinjiangensis TaxID=512762 RepID=A0A2S6IDL6_9ACTN|nr:alpha/beta fold hydrolase [Kineococcus xinjiangensis]PPK92312.1 polyhydroxyalkanoate synthase [Kineococcus xinjiangensis]
MSADSTSKGPDAGAQSRRSPYDEWREKLEEALDAATEGFPGSDYVGQLDPASFGPAVAEFTKRLASSPTRTSAAFLRYAADVTEAVSAGVLRAGGQDAEGPVSEVPRDKRFADPAWEQNPWYWALRQQHLLLERLSQELLESTELEGSQRAKTEFLLRQLLDASAPTNTLLGNPAALRKAFETGGQSLAKGARNFLDDLATNGGQPRQTVPGQFEVGRDLAATPGEVVFRNELMELIQYSPQTEQVREIPLLFSPPWINKFYMMDLAPGRSLVEWAVQQGLTVFVISYRNPDESMRGIRMDDYLVSGPRQAIDVIQDITGAEAVNVIGLCLGGTLTMATLAYLATVGDRRVRTGTLLNTLIDFSEPGVLGVFTDEATVERLERRMEKSGFLPGADMRATFDLLRSNDLIWNYVVNNWLMGEEPKAFDLLAWNADSTRMPAGMHSFYLRSCYLENQLARGVMELDGKELDLGAVTEDLYFVAAEQDHIAPWKSVYKGALLPKGDVRFVLTNSGHIAGVVNPPNPKSRHWVLDGAELPRDPDVWRSQAVESPRSWWEDWTPWISERSGELREPPPMGSERYPALEPAPGTYVHER